MTSSTVERLDSIEAGDGDDIITGGGDDGDDFIFADHYTQLDQNGVRN